MRNRYMLLLFSICPLSTLGCTADSGTVGGDPLHVSFETVATIGTLDGEAHEALGRLSTAAIHKELGLFLLDPQGGAALWYDFDGRFRGAVGGRGSGPGELGTPWAISAERDGTVWILDRENSRISRFGIRENNSVEHLGSVRGFFPDGNTCVLGGRLFVSGLRSGHTLHELTDDGIAASWGPAPAVDGIERAGEWRYVAEPQVLQGRVHCAEDAGLVVMAFASHPLLRAFDDAGVVRWEATLADFSPMGFTLGDNGRLRGDIDPVRGAHYLRSMVPWGDGRLLLQYEIRFPGPAPEGQDYHGLESRLISLRDGSELGRSHSLPWVAARNGESVITITNVPYPRAVVAQINSAP
jgi:hypothetical protein